MRRLVLRFLSFTGESHFFRIWLKAPTCYLLSNDSILLFPGAWLTWRPPPASVCPELKILFQISSDEKVLFLALKALANHLASFFFLYFSGRATTMTYIPFSVQPIIGHVVLVAFDLHSDCFSGQSLGLVSSNTEV